MTLQKGKGVTNQVDKSDRRKANIHLTEIMIAAAEAVVGKLSQERRAELIYYAQRIGVLEVVRILDGIKRSPGKYGWYTLLGQFSKAFFEIEKQEELT